MSNGGWIFISHSHQDIDKVRKIRNHFERLGYEPLMFYLKCLNDENEIEDLIKREIDERDWFIYADSENARKSKWVKTEREHIETRLDKKVFVINLDNDLETQFKEIEHIAKQMKVFISYSRRDEHIYNAIRNKLLEKDMKVVSDEKFTIGGNWFDEVANNIKTVCHDGFVLLLITQNSADSFCVEKEIELAKKEKGKIIPVYIGELTLISPNLAKIIDTEQGIHISCDPTEEELDKLIKFIFHRVEYYSSDFTNSFGYRSASTVHLPPISRIDELTFWDCDNLTCVYVPDTVVYITPDAFNDHRNVLIKCSPGSYCENYCKKHGLNYELI